MVQHDQRGASAVEYGLLVAGIATIVVSVIFVFGGMLNDKLFGVSCDTVAGQLSTSTTVDPNCP